MTVCVHRSNRRRDVMQKTCVMARLRRLALQYGSMIEPLDDLLAGAQFAATDRYRSTISTCRSNKTVWADVIEEVVKLSRTDAAT